MLTLVIVACPPPFQIPLTGSSRVLPLGFPEDCLYNEPVNSQFAGVMSSTCPRRLRLCAPGNGSARPVESPTGSVIVEHPFKGPDFLVRDILGVAGDAAAQLGCPLSKEVKRTVAARQNPDPRS